MKLSPAEAKMLHDFGMRPDHRKILGRGCRLSLWVGALMFCLGAAGAASGQVVPAGDAGGLAISAGATGSGLYLQYGERKMAALTGFVDIDSRSPFGIEAEGRWAEWKKTADVHTETYSIGPRYHRNIGNFQPYGKGLVGFGHFNFPYNLATGSYLIVTVGGGLDYRLRHRISIRAADIEYQYWPQFTYGAMSSFSVSAGIRVRVF